jgi:hypothetical protein
LHAALSIPTARQRFFQDSDILMHWSPRSPFYSDRPLATTRGIEDEKYVLPLPAGKQIVCRCDSMGPMRMASSYSTA